MNMELASTTNPMQFDLEVSTLITPETRNGATFEGAPLDLAEGQYVTEETNLLDAIIAAVRPLTTLVRRQADER